MLCGEEKLYIVTCTPTDREKVIVMCVCMSVPVPTLFNVSPGQCDWQLNKHFMCSYVCGCVPKRVASW